MQKATIQKASLAVKGTHIFTKCDATITKVRELSEQISALTSLREFLLSTKQAAPKIFSEIHEKYLYLKKIIKKKKF